MESGKSKIIIDLAITGHHTIFLKYVFDYINDKNDNVKYYFIINEKIRSNFVIKNPNIELCLINNDDIEKLFNENTIKYSLNITMFLIKKSKQFNVSDILIMDMNIYQFGLIFSNLNGLRIRGIIFSQYFRQEIISKKDYFRYFKRKLLIDFLIKKKSIKRIYFLNDTKGVVEENNKLKTNKFFNIPDPVNLFDIEKIINIKTKENIPKHHKIFLHYGSMDVRKGSLLILKSLLLLPEKEYDKFTIIFAGISSKNDINDSIDSSIKELKSKGVNFIHYNQFMNKQMTESLFECADYCLCPYTSVEASSGSVGLSIVSNTKIIGPNIGLLGEIIKESGLGIVLKIHTESDLAQIFIECINKDFSNLKSKVDLKTRSPLFFAEKLIEP